MRREECFGTHCVYASSRKIHPPYICQLQQFSPLFTQYIFRGCLSHLIFCLPFTQTYQRDLMTSRKKNNFKIIFISHFFNYLLKIGLFQPTFTNSKSTQSSSKTLRGDRADNIITINENGFIYVFGCGQRIINLTRIWRSWVPEVVNDHFYGACGSRGISGAWKVCIMREIWRLVSLNMVWKYDNPRKCFFLIRIFVYTFM